MFNRMKVLSGDDFITTNNQISVKHPKLSEIKEFGFDSYLNFVNFFTTEPHERAVSLYDAGIDFEEVTSYELFYNSFPVFSQNYGDLFKFFFGAIRSECEIKEYNEDNSLVLFYSDGSMKSLNRNDFHEICEFFKFIHSRQTREKPKFKNSHVKEIWIELEREELENSMKNKEENSGIEHLISVLVWAARGAVTWETIWNLHIYQLMDGIKRIDKEKEYEYFMYGVYNGTIDLKKTNPSKMHWTK